MLTHRRKSVSLSLISTDLPVWYVVQSAATLEQKDRESFHLILTEPQPATINSSPSLIWLEISPYRVMMTKQAGSQVCYRHFWERGVYGTSRYWLEGGYQASDQTLHLRNFTRQLSLEGDPLPQQLQVEYELWSAKVQLGRYILRLEIHL